MTEEEMMDLALRLSEQEASITALRLQKEEEAMMKAIQDSVSTESTLLVQYEYIHMYMNKDEESDSGFKLLFMCYCYFINVASKMLCSHLFSRVRWPENLLLSAVQSSFSSSVNKNTPPLWTELTSLVITLATN